MVKVTIAGLLFCVITVLKTAPLISHLSTHIPNDPGDPLLNTWILAWDFHALTTDPWNLFNANILYPAERALAFSEHLLGVLPFFMPIYALTGNPILAYNVVFLLSFALSGIAMFLLVHYWTRNFWASLVAGALFAFAPIRFDQLAHLQLLNLYWAPLALIFFERFLRSKGWRDLIGFAMFYWVQVLASVYLGWFTTIAIALYGLYSALFIDRDLMSRALVPRYMAFAVSSLLVLLPFHLDYYAVKQQWAFSRSLQECISYSADLLLSPLSVPPLVSDLYLSLFRSVQPGYAPHERRLFPGFVMPILVILSIFARDEHLSPEQMTRMKRLYWLVAVASCVLSLGPFLLILDRNTHIPLPYLLLYRIVPGFQAMRVPARFGFMAVLAASVLAALGFLKACCFLHMLPGFRRLAVHTCQVILAFSILGLFALELGFKPLPLVRIETGHDVPAVYRWLAGKTLDGPIVELPFGRWEDYRYTYFSTYHWLPLVNGHTGFIPPSYAQITAVLEALPSRSAVEYLGNLGVKGIVLHADRLQPHDALKWNQARLLEMGLAKVTEFGSDTVYKITLIPDVTAQLQLEGAVPDRFPPGARVRLGLLGRGMGQGAWTHPRPLGPRGAIVAWEEQQTGRISTQKAPLVLPLVIGAQEFSALSLSVRTPSAPGRYLLRLHFPGLDLSLAPTAVEVTTSPLATSLSAPQLLSAAYVLEPIQAHVLAAEPLDVRLKVTNTGEAIWLARTRDHRGTVRLGWRWFKGEEEIPSTLNRDPLVYDVFPGQTYGFRSRIATPSEPGEYRLELGLVSELVTWFFEQRVDPVETTIYVERHTGER